jgi:hypothetical protein
VGIQRIEQMQWRQPLENFQWQRSQTHVSRARAK